MPTGFDSFTQSKLGAFRQSLLGVRDQPGPQTVVCLALIDESLPEYSPAHFLYNFDLEAYSHIVDALLTDHNILVRSGILHIASHNADEDGPAFYLPITPFGVAGAEYEDHVAFLLTKGITIVQTRRFPTQNDIRAVFNQVRLADPTMDPSSRMQNVMVHIDNSISMVIEDVEDAVNLFLLTVRTDFENAATSQYDITLFGYFERWIESINQILGNYPDWPTRVDES